MRKHAFLLKICEKMQNKNLKYYLFRYMIGENPFTARNIACKNMNTHYTQNRVFNYYYLLYIILLLYYVGVVYKSQRASSTSSLSTPRVLLYLSTPNDIDAQRQFYLFPFRVHNNCIK